MPSTIQDQLGTPKVVYKRKGPREGRRARQDEGADHSMKCTKDYDKPVEYTTLRQDAEVQVRPERSLVVHFRKAHRRLPFFPVHFPFPIRNVSLMLLKLVLPLHIQIFIAELPRSVIKESHETIDCGDPHPPITERHLASFAKYCEDLRSNVLLMSKFNWRLIKRGASLMMCINNAPKLQAKSECGQSLIIRHNFNPL